MNGYSLLTARELYAIWARANRPNTCFSEVFWGGGADKAQGAYLEFCRRGFTYREFIDGPSFERHEHMRALAYNYKPKEEPHSVRVQIQRAAWWRKRCEKSGWRLP